MKNIYLDNAATTPMRVEVIEEITKSMIEDFGNPSSSHSFGRNSKNSLELSRKSIAKQINANSQEIVFTSGATEANNWILRSAVRDLKLTRIITSKIEHHAVLHAVEAIQKEFAIRVDYVKIQEDGCIDTTDLVRLLSDESPALVSLMHVNNETGAILDIEKTARICKQHSSFFHTDTVQSVGKVKIDLQAIPIDFLVASAHKFHGPKGVGFAFIRKGLLVNPIFFGGEQEKGLRPGTEAVHNIVGMAKALTFAYQNLDEEKIYIENLKKYTINQLQNNFEGIKINGHSEKTLYTILNILLPFSTDKSAMILFNLDIKGIAVSRGSACQSGSPRPSHVLAEMLNEEDLLKPSLRISFSHFNTKEEIDYFISVLKGI